MKKNLKTIFIAVFLLSLSACCNDDIEKNVNLVKSNKTNYKYKVLLNGIRCYLGHPTDPLSPFFISKKQHKVQDIIQFNKRFGTLTPKEFRLKMTDFDSIVPQKALQGSITLNKDSIKIDLKIEQLKNKYIPYYFNGTYAINN